MQHDQTEEFLYQFQGRLHQIDVIGPVPDGVRMDSRFAGTIVAGPLTGATVEGIDYFRVRDDGVGVITGYEQVTFEGHRIGVELTGYILPPDDLPTPSREQLRDPGFTWPDVPFRIEAFATFHTAAPELAHLNRVAVTHTGTVNMATGDLFVEARRLRPARSTVATATTP